ncbi:MAG: tetratricopeptide repeat protein, partial [Dinghuibacter sp.]|nr:tetratricopeptide repeat protein [Dinghuibacter sp.]
MQKNYLLGIALLLALSSAAQPWRVQTDSLVQLARQSHNVARQTDWLTRASLIALFHQPDTAMQLSNEAVQLAEQSRNDTLMAMAYAAKSAVYVIKDDNPATLEYALKGLTISERTPLPPDILASLYRKTGYVYRNQKDYAASIRDYKKSLAFSQLSGNRHDVCATSSNLGQILALNKQYDRALHYHRVARDGALENGFNDIVVRAGINIVNAYNAMGNRPQTMEAIQELAPQVNRPGVTPIVQALAYTAMADKLLRYV